MSLRSYLSVMTITTLICWVAFGFIVNMVDPEKTNQVGFFLFYLSLFVATVGTTAILGFLARFVVLKKELVMRLVLDAFRQSFLLALFIDVVLLLLAKNLFSWLNCLLLILGLSMLEFLLLGYGQDQRGVAMTSENN